MAKTPRFQVSFEGTLFWLVRINGQFHLTADRARASKLFRRSIDAAIAEMSEVSTSTPKPILHPVSE
jgi:hypothetical protein